MRNAFFFFVLISILIFFGCSDQRIVFKGEVHRGEITYQYRISGDTTSGVVEVLVDIGPWSGCYVKEIDHEEFALTDSNGRYTLEIDVPRKLGYPSPEEFTLQAWAPSGAVARNEKIEYYVHARPGETVQVRPFLLTYHTHEEIEEE
ncbi:MAG: hypothetical protein J7L42_05995 [Elusimicrobia bacterium]|nr:hypothetical protein [Elusimicrobiota bacterium]